MIEEVTKLMGNMFDKWAICGGDAIDLFVGKKQEYHNYVEYKYLKGNIVI